MKTRLVLVTALVGLLFSFQPAFAQDCEFQLGFKALRDLIPDVVGDCLENERHDLETGVTLQTTTNGQLIWRKAENWTGFTDGERTWINGLEGLQQRLNSERFDWEAPAASPMATQHRALVIESPLPGEMVASGVEVRGTTTAAPSGDGLRYLVYDARGGVIGMGTLPVEGLEDSPGSFAAPVEFMAGEGGPGRIEIVDVDAGDGSALARTTVPVVLEATPSMYGGPPMEEPDRPVRELVLEAPLSGATVGAEIEVRGRVSAMPFEKNLTYRIYDAAGTVVGESYITVEGDLDGPGTFTRSIAVTGTTAPGRLRIEVRDVSEADGSLFVSTWVEVWFAGG